MLVLTFDHSNDFCERLCSRVTPTTLIMVALAAIKSHSKRHCSSRCYTWRATPKRSPPEGESIDPQAYAKSTETRFSLLDTCISATTVEIFKDEFPRPLTDQEGSQ